MSFNGYWLHDVFQKFEPPAVKSRVNLRNRHNVRKEIERMQRAFCEFYFSKIKDVRVLPKHNALTKLTQVVQEDAISDCPFAPSSFDDWITKKEVLGSGSYGKAFTVELSGKCVPQMDRRVKHRSRVTAVVKQSVDTEDPLSSYENIVHEVLINQIIIRNAILKLGLSTFPLMFAFLVCEPDRDSRFCKTPSQSRQVVQMNNELREGIQQMFPVFEKVKGVSMFDILKKDTFNPDDFHFVYNILKQVLNTLNLLNQHHVYTHNDLHVVNLMVTLPSRWDGSQRLKPMIIDQGLAAGGYIWRTQKYLAIHSNSLGCFMGTDIFSLLVGFFTEIGKSTQSEQMIAEVLIDLFGIEVMGFVASSVSDYLSYVAYLQYLLLHRNSVSFVKAWSVNHKSALTVLDERYRDFIEQNAQYQNRKVQRRVLGKVRRHVEKHPNFAHRKRYENFKELFHQKQTKKIDEDARFLDQEIDQIHTHMQTTQQRVCDCLPKP